MKIYYQTIVLGLATSAFAAPIGEQKSHVDIAIGGLVERASSVVSGLIGARQSDCKPITVLFARGTGEPGTLGSVTGEPFAKALASVLGEDKVNAVGVDYPASSMGNANMGATGGRAMKSQADELLSSCPDTKLVLGGYSQGAMAVHNALSAQDLDGSKVAAILVFGDPLAGTSFEGVDESKAKGFCATGDFLCSRGGTNMAGTHLSYTSAAEPAAEFAAQALGESGSGTGSGTGTGSEDSSSSGGLGGGIGGFLGSSRASE